jgi:threonylcarbamoyladenosine tRNA methylthiotransferase MtaB
VRQAEQVAADGGREIVIAGVNIGDFGKGTDESIIDLLRRLDEVKGIERYRISSLEPDLLTDEIIRFVASSRAFMPHFHIPLQCGSDDVLKLMRRHYDSALFAEKVHLIRQLIPDAFIGVDVMAGTRGETPELFLQSFDFISSLDVTRLHVFPYSERPGTMALRIPYIVSQKVKNERVEELIDLSDRKLRDFIGRYIGTVRPVLFEQPHEGKPMHGFTDNYIKVEVPPDESLVNTVGNVRLLRLRSDDIVEGEIV